MTLINKCCQFCCYTLVFGFAVRIVLEQLTHLDRPARLITGDMFMSLKLTYDFLILIRLVQINVTKEEALK